MFRIKTYSLMLLLLGCSACGLMGIATSERTTVTDHVQREAIIYKLENTAQARYQDSLMARIDEATVTVPIDLATTTLVVETYETYAEYQRVFHNKLNPHDTTGLKKSYSKYEKKKTRLFKNPRYRTVYADKKTYEEFDPLVYRYVLKSTVKYDYNPETLSVSTDGTGIAYVVTRVDYLYDRQTGAVFGELTNLKALEK